MNNSWKKTFAIIWGGQLFSTLTSSIVGYAVVFWLSLKTESAEVLAYAMIATLLPQLVLGVFTGVFVDRWNRKLTMICADSFIAICTAAMCLMFYFDTVTVWQIYVLLILRSVGSAFHAPAMQASVPLLAPESELMRVAGVNQIIFSISNIAGPALAALLINIMDMTYVLSLDIIGALIACTSLLFVIIPNPEKADIEKVPNVFREIKEGLHAIFGIQGLKWVLLCDVVMLFFIIPMSALFPLITLTHFMGDTYDMSIVEASWGVGIFMGGVLVSMKRVKMMNKIVLIGTVSILIGLTALFSGLLPQNALIWFIALTTVSGVGGAIWNSSFTVILQTKIDAAVLGRAFSTYDSLMLLPSLPGLLATGFIADAIGITNVFVIAGIAICLIGCLFFIIPSVVSLGKSTVGK